MKRKAVFFILGLALCTLGFALYLQGPKRYIRYESENLGYWTKSIAGENSEEILWYFSGYVRYFASNLTLVMNVSVLDRPLWVYVLKESQFAIWQENGTTSQAFVSKNVMDRFDFAFETEENETYHFIARNPSNVTSSVHLWLRSEGNFLRFDYTLMPLHLLFLASGLGICFVFGRKCSPMFSEFLKKWSLPIYKPLGKRKHDKEEIALHFEAILRMKRVVKYFVLILLSIVTLLFIYETVSLFDFIVNLRPLRPEHKFLLMDFLIRKYILMAMLLLPLLVGTPFLLLIIVPRHLDLSDILKSKLGSQRRSKKQWLIEKSMYGKLVQETFSSKFLVFCVLLFLPVPIVFLFASPLVISAYTTAFLSAFSIWAGYTLWSGFHEACVQHGIGKYAIRRYIKSSTIDFIVLASILWICASLMVLFASSNFWISTIESIVFEPVTLLEPFSEIIPIATVQFPSFIFVLGILFCFASISFLFFILFPYLHRMGIKGIGGFFVIFGLTYMTECLVSWIFQGTVSVVIQPLGIISPAIAALVSQVAQNKYTKMIQKRLA